MEKTFTAWRAFLAPFIFGEKEVIIACTVAFVGLAGTGMLDKSANSIAFPGELETAILIIDPRCYHVLLRFALLRMLARTHGTSCALALALDLYPDLRATAHAHFHVCQSYRPFEILL